MFKQFHDVFNKTQWTETFENILMQIFENISRLQFITGLQMFPSSTVGGGSKFRVLTNSRQFEIFWFLWFPPKICWVPWGRKRGGGVDTKFMNSFSHIFFSYYLEYLWFLFWSSNKFEVPQGGCRKKIQEFVFIQTEFRGGGRDGMEWMNCLDCALPSDHRFYTEKCSF